MAVFLDFPGSAGCVAEGSSSGNSPARNAPRMTVLEHNGRTPPNKLLICKV
jgi:hypothetical protein